MRHPNAVAVLDDGEEPDGTAFLVMELLEGRSLAKLLGERGALTVCEVVAAALSILEVLAAAHDNGVVHRDVKPGNIFATVDGRFKLLDFGVAQVADLASGVVTQTGGTLGTPAFMAPEQAAGRLSEVDALTDIWAVGATMFQLLTNRLVHQASSRNGMIVAAATVSAPPIRSLAPNVPIQVAHVIERALAFERCERWPNARAMHLALRTAYREPTQVAFVEPLDPETVPEQRPTSAGDKKQVQRARFKPWQPLLIIAPLLLGVLALLGPRGRTPSAKGTPPASALVTRPVTIFAATSSVAAQVSSAKVLDTIAPTKTPPKVESKVTPGALSVARRASGNKPASVPLTPPTDDDLLDRRK